MPPTPLFIVVLHLIQPFWTAPKILNREKLEAVSSVEGSKLLTAVELLSNKGTWESLSPWGLMSRGFWATALQS